MSLLPPVARGSRDAMATTAIWAIKGSIANVVKYVENPDKTANPEFVPQMIAEAMLNEQALRDVISYSTRDEKTDRSHYVTGLNCGPDTAREDMMETKQRFGKMGGNVVYHGYQSFAPGEVTPDLAHDIGIKLAQELWGDRFEVIVATHLDKAHHIHNHFLLNSVSFADGGKYNDCKATYRLMRDTSDRLCREHSLSVIRNPQPGRAKHYGEWNAEQQGRPTWRGMVKADIDAAIAAAQTDRQFFDLLRKKGYAPNTGDIAAIEQTQCGIGTNSVDITYDNKHNVTGTADQTGVETTYTYNNQGQVTGKTITKGGLQTTETMTYTADGNYLAAHTDARGGTTKYYYDNDPTGLLTAQKGLLTNVIDPEGNETKYVYDSNTDELVSTTGLADSTPLATTSVTTQDHMPKTITRNGGTNSAVTYSYNYDTQNRVTAAMVGGQTLITNAYDNRQRLAQQTFINGATYTPMYDSRDRLASDKWDNTQTSAYFYNENDRLSQVVDYTFSTSITSRYGYSFDGLLESITGSDGTQTKLGYDIKGLLSSLTFTENGDTIHDAWYSSDNQGRPTKASLFSLDGASLAYDYDEMGRLTERSLETSSTVINSPVTYIEGQNGSVTDLVSQYTNEDIAAGVTIQQYDYGYDANGNITSITDAAGKTTTYTYDGLNRLTSESDGTTTFGYDYDANGNLDTVMQDSSPLHSYSYNKSTWKDQLSAFDNKAITYDSLGNPLTYDGKTFSWQRGRQLAGITGGGDNISYTYDAAGRRASKTVATAGSPGGVTTTYTYANDTLIRQSDGTNTLDFTYDASGKAVGFMHNGTPYFYLRNLQNDVVAIVDAEGTTVAAYEYDAWGNMTVIDDFVGPMPGPTLAEINPIRYRGYYYDNETGYYFLQTRYYSPEWRRFLNADSTFVAGEDMLGGSNMYAYCNGNPVMLVDPTGQGAVGDFLRKVGTAIYNGVDVFFNGIADIGDSIGHTLYTLTRNLLTIADGLDSMNVWLFNMKMALEIGRPVFSWLSRIFPEPDPDNDSFGATIVRALNGIFTATAIFTGVGAFACDVAIGWNKFMIEVTVATYNLFTEWGRKFGWGPEEPELEICTDDDVEPGGSGSGAPPLQAVSPACPKYYTHSSSGDLIQANVFYDGSTTGKRADLYARLKNTQATGKEDVEWTTTDMTHLTFVKGSENYTIEHNSVYSQFYAVVTAQGRTDICYDEKTKVTAALKIGTKTVARKTMTVVVIKPLTEFALTVPYDTVLQLQPLYPTKSSWPIVRSDLYSLSVKKGATVTVCGEVNNWYYVRTSNGSYRFMKKPFIWPLAKPEPFSNDITPSYRPSNFTITSPFGFRINDDVNPPTERHHWGIDVSASGGTTVVAMADGKVIDSDETTEIGHYVDVLHEKSGYVTRYQHLKANTRIKTIGTYVEQNYKIAETGNTGKAGTYHLHYNIYRNALNLDNPLTSLVNPLATRIYLDDGTIRVAYDTEDIRGHKERNQQTTNPVFLLKTGGKYEYDPSFNWDQWDAYWNGWGSGDRYNNPWSRQNNKGTKTTNPYP